MQLRATRSTEAWQWPGGNMDHGEPPWECALRECPEETGIVIEGERKLLGTQFVVHRGEAWPANHIGFLLDSGTLTDGQIAAIVLDPEEHSEVRALDAGVGGGHESVELRPPARDRRGSPYRHGGLHGGLTRRPADPPTRRPAIRRSAGQFRELPKRSR
ncbi:NUDIX domain-containing protein [Streptomyces sp. H34-S4]|uniref:NUDIX domain-containing protein n=1 Tax=Streptomyces sp. H34-S4 TaxID=2996463 RepID=UPI0022711219|nr:NUDIX hydrolase [Streptomyces sp. H34-S4]MCY0934889.1 NUDIX hydrolase [Streptomyces sp. H34-S4]